MGEVVVGGVDVGGMMWMGCVLEVGVVWAVDGQVAGDSGLEAPRGDSMGLRKS